MKALFTTLHAKYVHASLALPYLAAACSNLEGVESVIREFTINEPPDGVLQQIIAENADVLLFSCYIWNIEQTLKLVADLKQIRPDLLVVLGGPEASHGVFELLEKNPGVYCIVRGEGEESCRELLEILKETGSRGLESAFVPGVVFRKDEEMVAGPRRSPLSELDTILSPFTAGLVEMQKPLVYYETSRGCPFSCAFCMSSLEEGVRSFSMQRIKSDLTVLMERGVRTVKLVDRTFNYDATRADEIWSFILSNNGSSRFHFEIAADLLTEANLELLAKVPKDTFRFEIGIQSGNPETLKEVSRKSDLEKLFRNVRRLVTETDITIHLDLVAGLPHESFDRFLESLQSLIDLAPHHIQVEPLKVLKGSAMRKIADRMAYAYSSTPPYKILKTPWLRYEEVCRIELVSRLVDLVYNSGKFAAGLQVLEHHSPLAPTFDSIAAFWQSGNLPMHLSQTALFEALRQFGTLFLPERLHTAFTEALCYDFCLAEYPSGGNSPTYLHHEQMKHDRSTGKPAYDIASLPDFPPGSKVRTFRRRFAWDFREKPFLQRTVDLVFMYASSPGRGLLVHVRDTTQL